MMAAMSCIVASPSGSAAAYHSAHRVGKVNETAASLLGFVLLLALR
jgi:hypothetical protein